MKKNIFIKEITVNNKPLIITNAVEHYISKNPLSAGFLLLSGAFSRNIRLGLKHLEKLASQGVIIHDNSEEALKELLHEEFVLIEAAGGLVITPNNELLMIYRRGHWDLPKGKIDKGEDDATAAIREVQEETGLQYINIDNYLTATYHYYMQDDQKILKKTYWYKMSTPQSTSLVPQVEEDISIAKWVTSQEIPELLKNTYSTIHFLVSKYYLH